MASNKEDMQHMRYFDWLEHHANRRRNQLALHDIKLRKKRTYGQLNEVASRLAAHFKNRGIESGDRVALLIPNCVEFFELQFACAKLGALCVPINWRLAVRELQHILNDCDPTILVFHEMFAEKIPELKKDKMELLELKEDSSKSDYSAAIEFPEKQRQASLSMNDTWLLLYTSGTTGLPKGVQITYQMVLMNILNMGLVAGVSDRSVQLALLPFFHVGGINLYANPILHAGGKVLILRDFEPATVLHALSDKSLGINVFFAVPTQLQMIAQLPEFETTDLSTIKYACVGGSACPETLLNKWLGKGVPLSQGWGMTETGPGSLVLDSSDALRKIGSCGKPVMYNDVLIVNDKFERVKSNKVGQLVVRGPNVTPGYWRNTEANSKDFFEGWLKTGDAARVDEDGFFYIVDRIKDMYISGGENIYPAEIENILFELPGIAEAAVVGIPDKKWGEVGLAVLVKNPAIEISEETIFDYCTKNLAKFKVPKKVLFTDALPKTASGKVQKSLLPTLLNQA